MIHVIAIITAKPGKREEVLNEFSKIIPTVLQEEGCIEYGPTIDAENAGGIQTALGPDSYAVIEKWSSIETLAAHGKAAHMAEYAAKVKHLLADRVIHVLSPAG